MYAVGLEPKHFIWAKRFKLKWSIPGGPLVSGEKKQPQKALRNLIIVNGMKNDQMEEGTV